MEQWHDLSSEPAQTILPKNQRRINRPIFIFGLLISKTKYWKIEKNHTKIEIWHFPFSISIRNRMNFIVMPSILIFMYKTTNSRKNVDFCKREPFFCNRYHICHVKPFQKTFCDCIPFRRRFFIRSFLKIILTEFLVFCAKKHNLWKITKLFALLQGYGH